MTAPTVDAKAHLEGIPEHVYDRRWSILAVLCTSLLIVIIGNTSLNVAIPTLARDLKASDSQLQWMIDAYSLIFAGLLFSAGTIGDRFGRKGTLQAGLAVFLLGAVVATTATTASGIIAARAVMGVAAAFVMPSTLSILTNVFPAHERAKAIAIWAGVSGGGAAIGPIASGFLLEHFWFGSVFLVNVPVIFLALIVGAFLLPTSKDPDENPLDIPGALLSIVGLGALVYGIIEGPHHGWRSTESMLIFGVSALALALFAAWELRTRFPMLDLRYFKDRRYSVASAGMMLTFFAMFGTFFLIAQYFQLVLGYSPLESGLFQLPFAFVIMGVSPQVPKLVVRFGPARVVPVGLLSVALGLAAFSTLGVDSPVLRVYTSILPLAFGMALTMTPLTTLIMSSIPLGKAGVGSATNDTTRELGGALGVAVLGSLVTTTFSSHLGSSVSALPAAAREQAQSGLSGALGVAARMGPSGDALAAAAKSAFVDGLGVAAVVGAGVVLVAATVAWFLLPHHAVGQTVAVGAAAAPGDFDPTYGAADVFPGHEDHGHPVHGNGVSSNGVNGTTVDLGGTTSPPDDVLIEQ